MIDDTAKDWGAAEAQAARLVTGRGGGSTVLSVRQTAPVGQKRKAEASEGGGGKKSQKGKKAKRS